MKFLKVIVLSTLLFGFTLASINTNQASAASEWGEGIHSSISYFYVGAGWGSGDYYTTLTEEYSYTYRTELYFHQTDFYYRTSAPYQAELRYVNKYYDRSSGSYKGGYNNYASSGRKWDAIGPGSPYKSDFASSGTNYYSNAGGNFKLTHTVQMYVYKSGGWLYGGSKTHTKYIP